MDVKLITILSDYFHYLSACDLWGRALYASGMFQFELKVFKFISHDLKPYKTTEKSKVRSYSLSAS